MEAKLNLDDNKFDGVEETWKDANCSHNFECRTQVQFSSISTILKVLKLPPSRAMKGRWNKFVWDTVLYDFHGETDAAGKPFPPDP